MENQYHLPNNNRTSIMHTKSIPKKANKVQFSIPGEEDKKSPNFMSPESRVSRRTTIQHNKMNVDVLHRYSMLVAGKISVLKHFQVNFLMIILIILLQGRNPYWLRRKLEIETKD